MHKINASRASHLSYARGSVLTGFVSNSDHPSWINYISTRGFPATSLLLFLLDLLDLSFIGLLLLKLLLLDLFSSYCIFPGYIILWIGLLFTQYDRIKATPVQKQCENSIILEYSSQYVLLESLSEIVSCQWAFYLHLLH